MSTDSALTSFLAQGTAADRAAFVPDPPKSSSGYLWFETDTGLLWAWNQTGTPAWVQIGGGGADPLFLPPDPTDFPTLLDPASDVPTFTTETEGAVLASGVLHTSANIKGFFKPVPVSTPYNIDLRFRPGYTNTNHMGFGLFLRDSGTGKLLSFHLEGAGSNVVSNTWNSATSFNGNNFGFSVFEPPTMRISFDGTDYTFWIGSGITNFLKVGTVSAASWITADEIGIAFNAQDDGGAVPTGGNGGATVTYYNES